MNGTKQSSYFLCHYNSNNEVCFNSVVYLSCKILNGAAQLLVTTVHYRFTLTYLPFFLCSHSYVAIVAAAQPQSSYGNCLIVKAAAPADSRLKKKRTKRDAAHCAAIKRKQTNKQKVSFLFIYF